MLDINSSKIPKTIITTVLAIISLFGSNQIMSQIQNTELLQMIKASYDNKVFVEAGGYCWSNSDAGTVTYATIDNQTSVEIAFLANDYDWPDDYEGPGKFGYGDFQMNFSPTIGGKVVRNINYDFANPSTGYLGPWSIPLNHPNYTLTYYPDPGFSGTENITYMGLQAANGTAASSCTITSTISITVTEPQNRCDDPKSAITSFGMTFGAGSVYTNYDDHLISYDPNLQNNRGVASFDTAGVECNLQTDTDLAIVKTLLDQQVAGQTARYNLRITNNGPLDDPGPITVVDTLPPQLSFVSATGTGWSCNHNNGQVTCTKNDGLTVGSSSEIQILVNVTG
jgi:uncharacterized repeat protein (TIGR01451 family)